MIRALSWPVYEILEVLSPDLCELHMSLACSLRSKALHNLRPRASAENTKESKHPMVMTTCAIDSVIHQGPDFLRGGANDAFSRTICEYRH